MPYVYKDGKFIKTKPSKKRTQSETATLEARIAELEAVVSDRDKKIAELEAAQRGI